MYENLHSANVVDIPPPFPPNFLDFIQDIELDALFSTRSHTANYLREAGIDVGILTEPLDLLSVMQHSPRLMWTLTRLKIGQFRRIFDMIQGDMGRPFNLYDAPLGIRYVGGNRNLTPQNQLLLVLIWLAHYDTHEYLGSVFGVGTWASWSLVQHIVPILSRHLGSRIRGLEDLLWRDQQRGRIPGFPNGIAFIDGTMQRICRPSQHQREFYSGRKKYHGLNTQVVVDHQGIPVHVVSSFPGRYNDMNCFHISRIARYLDRYHKLIGDGIYKHKYCISPFDRPIASRYRRLRRFNKRLRRQRSLVERSICWAKRWRVLKRQWRGRLEFHPIVVQAVWGLTRLQLVRG